MENTTLSSQFPIWVTIIQIGIWPLVLIGIIIYFRKQLKFLLSNIKTFSIAGIDIKIVHAKEFLNYNKLVSIEEFGAMSQNGQLTSYVHSLTDFIETTSECDFIIIDLGEGDKWLTSRLFILTRIIAINTGLKRVVFVTSNKRKKRLEFQGIIEVDKLCWNIASKFREYEIVYCKLYNQVLSSIDSIGAISKNDATELMLKFINEMQSEEINNDRERAIELNGNVFEYGQWLNIESIRSIFRSNLDASAVKSSWTKKKRIRKTIEQEGDFTVVTNKAGDFQYLINRRKMIEAIIKCGI